MKAFITTLLTCIIFSLSSYSQTISVTASGTLATLMNQLKGSGVVISNPVFSGDADALGKFTCVNCNLGVEGGAIISTGEASNASTQGANSTTFSLPGDADLDLQSGLTTFDAAVLEFDVTPLSSYFKIKFQLASYEYNTFVTSLFRDPVGIYISGPGITGKQNIALVPNSSLPVNITTINNGLAPPAGPCVNCSYFVDNPNRTEIGYTGYTTVLTGAYPVTAGNTYHIKIAVADVTDSWVDTGLLLANGTFSSSTTPYNDCSTLAVNITSPSVNCNGTQKLFCKPSTPGTYSYHWQPDTLFVDPTVQNPTLNQLVSLVNFSVALTDSQISCTVTDTASIQYYDNSVSSVNSCHVPNPIQFTATAYPGATYLWNTGETTLSISVDTAGNYFCSTQVPGCNFQQYFSVIDTCSCNVVLVNNNNPSCNIATVFGSVFPSQPYIYEWSPSYLNDDSQVILIKDLMINEPVVITITHPYNGCTASDTILVTNYGNETDSLLFCDFQDTLLLQLPPIATPLQWTYTTDPPAMITGYSIVPMPSQWTAMKTGLYATLVNYSGCPANYSYDFVVKDTCVFLHPVNDYYWVNGSGLWTDTLHWATSSGGNTHYSNPPTGNDNIIFDSGSGLTDADSVKVNIPFQGRNITIDNNDTTNFHFSSINKKIFCYNNLNINSPLGMRGSGGGTSLYFYSDSIGNTVNAGDYIYFDTEFKGNGSWALTNKLEGDFRLMFNKGTLYTNNYPVSYYKNISFIDSEEPKTLYGGSSVFTTNTWNAGTFTNTTDYHITLDMDSATVIIDSTAVTVGDLYFATRADQYYHKLIAKSTVEVKGISRIGSVSTGNGLNIRSRTIVDSLTVGFDDNITNGGELHFSSDDTLTINNYFETSVATGQLGRIHSVSPVLHPGRIQLMQGTACLDSLAIDAVHSIGPGIIYTGENSTDGGNNSGFVFTACGDDLVWPGDANNDLTADNLDFLYIAQANSAAGPARTNPSNLWISQSAADWTSSFSNGLNYKHADCNGDGTINMSDTTAIIQNYGLTHARNADNNSTAGAPAISLDIIEDSVAWNQDMHVNILLGNTGIPVDSIYGLAFTITADPFYIDTNQISYINYGGSALGTYQTNLFAIEKHFASNAQLHCAVSRTDHNNQLNVNGILGQLTLKTKTVIGNSGNSTLQLSNIYAVTSSGNEIPLNTVVDSVFIDATSFISENKSQTLVCYPNPATGTITVAGITGKLLRTEIISQSGAQHQLAVASSNKIDLSNFADGFYLLRFITDKNVLVTKIEIRR